MKQKIFTKQAQELAYEILMSVDLDDRAEYGEITVDSDLLFRFYLLANTVGSKEPA
jgi:hypothetical protein